MDSSQQNRNEALADCNRSGNKKKSNSTENKSRVEEAKQHFVRQYARWQDMVQRVTDAYFLPNHETYMIGVIEQCQKQAVRVFRNVTCEVKLYQSYLKEKIEHVHQQIVDKRRLLEKGLTDAIIQKFHHFTADESLIGDQCTFCMEDVQKGRKMTRLDCDGQHAFCQVCIKKWFTNHNTCPVCRHKFQ